MIRSYSHVFRDVEDSAAAVFPKPHRGRSVSGFPRLGPSHPTSVCYRDRRSPPNSTKSRNTEKALRSRNLTRTLFRNFRDWVPRAFHVFRDSLGASRPGHLVPKPPGSPVSGFPGWVKAHSVRPLAGQCPNPQIPKHRIDPQSVARNSYLGIRDRTSSPCPSCRPRAS